MQTLCVCTYFWGPWYSPVSKESQASRELKALCPQASLPIFGALLTWALFSALDILFPLRRIYCPKPFSLIFSNNNTNNAAGLNLFKLLIFLWAPVLHFVGLLWKLNEIKWPEELMIDWYINIISTASLFSYFCLSSWSTLGLLWINSECLH